jgi:uncharacterized membrane protein YkvA (DUF1232 family)
VALTWIQCAKEWARTVKRDAIALWIAARDPRTPWYAKVIAGFIAAYAFSPIDLIPDFIPLIGYLDDLILLPIGILAAVALIPPPLMAEFRDEARRRADRPTSWFAAALVIAVWITASIGVGAIAWNWLEL